MIDLKVLHEDEVESNGNMLVVEFSQLDLAGARDMPNSIGVVNDAREGKLYLWRRKIAGGDLYASATFGQLLVIGA